MYSIHTHTQIRMIRSHFQFDIPFRFCSVHFSSVLFYSVRYDSIRFDCISCFPHKTFNQCDCVSDILPFDSSESERNCEWNGLKKKMKNKRGIRTKWNEATASNKSAISNRCRLFAANSFDHSIEFQKKINVTNSTKTFNISIIILEREQKINAWNEIMYMLQTSTIFFYDLLFAMLRSYWIEMKDMNRKKNNKEKRKKETKIAWNRDFVSNKCDTIHFYCIQCVHIENYRFFSRLAFRYHCHTHTYFICIYIDGLTHTEREKEKEHMVVEWLNTNITNITTTSIKATTHSHRVHYCPNYDAWNMSWMRTRLYNNVQYTMI